MMKKILYIVHAIDTEGPLYQKKSNYKSYISEVKKINSNEKNFILKDILNNNLSKKTISSKIKLKKQINKISSKKFRSSSLDSFKNFWVYNWFILNHHGWSGKNPRKRLLGPFQIYDLYDKFRREKKLHKDDIYYHYHPKPLSEDYHRSGYTISNSDHITSTLSQILIERNYFPNCYRAGHTAERFDLHIFLEQWIPFDFSNHSTKKNKNFTSTPRFGDWRFADKTWTPYHPDFYDYQKKGKCKRLIARSLPIYSRDYSISDSDVNDAFKEASKKGKALLSFFGHDFKNIEKEVDIVRTKIEKIKLRYPKVLIKFSKAVDAIRKVSNIKNKIFKLEANIIRNNTSYPKLIIKSNSEIFGIQPFLSIKYKSKYIWQNLDFEFKNTWSYTFDEHNLLLKDVEKLSIAANSKFGKTIILRLIKSKFKFKKIILNN